MLRSFVVYTFAELYNVRSVGCVYVAGSVNWLFASCVFTQHFADDVAVVGKVIKSLFLPYISAGVPRHWDALYGSSAVFLNGFNSIDLFSESIGNTLYTRTTFTEKSGAVRINRCHHAEVHLNRKASFSLALQCCMQSAVCTTDNQC